APAHTRAVRPVVGVAVVGGDLSVDTGAREVFTQSVPCIMELIGRMTDPGVALGVVTDLESLGLIPTFPPAGGGRGEAIDAAVASAGRLGQAAQAITKLGPALTTLYDRIFDNIGADSTAHITLTSAAATEPPTLDEIAVPEPSAADAPVMIVVDRSGSMAEEVAGGVKIEVAKVALLNFIETVEAETPIGLWSYPARISCGDGQLSIPVEVRNPSTMAPVIRTLVPDGGTPTAEALTAAWQHMLDLGYDAGTVILVSDGESTCADPCVAARDLAASGFSVQFIGVGFGEISLQGQEELECIAAVTDGTAVRAEDDDALQEVIDDASRTDLLVSIDAPSSVVAEVGNTDDGNVVVTARVSNPSNVQAENVIVAISFDSENPGVVSPVRSLGNLSPGEALSVEWTFRPSLLLAGSDVALTITATADNLDRAETRSRSIGVFDLASSADAGDILRDGFVIMGDSYSAGEGADGYINGTDIDDNRCHRSRHTYLVEAFDLPNDHILACSGAVAHHLSNPNEEYGLPSQIDQLQALGERPEGPPSGVVMTMGGNDVGFGKVVLYCLVITCTDVVDDEISLPCLLTPCETGIISGDGFLVRTFDLESFSVGDAPTTFAAMMASRYAEVDDRLNHPAWMAERGTVAPILVLAYPRPIPTVDVSCPVLTAFVNQAELDFLNRYITLLNANLEAAVEAAHADGVPVYFVPNTETAFLPNHTICDDEPFVRSLQSLNGAGIDIGSLVDILNPLSDDDERDALAGFAARSFQELFHPNGDGYDAMTNAVLRWTQSAPADAAAEDLRTRGEAIETSIPVQPSAPIIVETWPVSDVDLGQLGSAATVSPGTEYMVSVQGYAPASPVRLVVESEPMLVGVQSVGVDGAATLSVLIPDDLPPGDHTLTITGVGPDGAARSTVIPLVVSSPLWSEPWFVLLTVALVLALAGVATELLGRRRARLAASTDTRGGSQDED
ncbi:MAG: VWA domain-containing protein, partial [Actinomycetota bacterium]